MLPVFVAASLATRQAITPAWGHGPPGTATQFGRRHVCSACKPKRIKESYRQVQERSFSRLEDFESFFSHLGISKASVYWNVASIHGPMHAARVPEAGKEQDWYHHLESFSFWMDVVGQIS
jgi:hypothetical protein